VRIFQTLLDSFSGSLVPGVAALDIELKCLDIVRVTFGQLLIFLAAKFSAVNDLDARKSSSCKKLLRIIETALNSD
jgi:hypothetical protein